MFTTLKLAVRLMVVAAALAAALVVHTGSAAAATPCWKSLLNDWYDGRIDQTYAVHCYQDALRHLPADVQTYSSAHDDILRALQSAVAQVKASGHKAGPNTLVAPPAVKPGKSGTGGKGTKGGKGYTTTTTAPTGRKPDKGISHLADELNPSSASSLPLPLLVLGGLAILLVAAGGAGLVAKRVQARRQTP